MSDNYFLYNHSLQEEFLNFEDLLSIPIDPLSLDLLNDNDKRKRDDSSPPNDPFSSDNGNLSSDRADNSDTQREESNKIKKVDQLDSSKKGDGNKRSSKKPGRKPIMDEPASKRQAQNRAAQRAFRERKEKYVKELEDKVAELEAKNQKQTEENQKLKSTIEKLKVENYALKSLEDAEFTFRTPSSFSTQQKSSPSSSDSLSSSPEFNTHIFQPVQTKPALPCAISENEMFSSQITPSDLHLMKSPPFPIHPQRNDLHSFDSTRIVSVEHQDKDWRDSHFEDYLEPSLFEPENEILDEFERVLKDNKKNNQSIAKTDTQAFIQDPDIKAYASRLDDHELNSLCLEMLAKASCGRYSKK